MSQYGTLLAHAKRIGAKAVLSDGMKAQMKRHFPKLLMISVSEIKGLHSTGLISHWSNSTY